MTDPSQTTRKLIILGSTGSIGVNTLNVVRHLNETIGYSTTTTPAIEVVGLAAGRNVELLIEQAKAFDVINLAIADESKIQQLKQALPNANILAGHDASLNLVENTHATDVSAAVVGSAGLPATLAAAGKGLTIGLANKETLVAAGALVTPLLRKSQGQLIPVDSEHSAIFQCLEGHRRANGHTQNSNSAVKRIVLTASGGPFRSADKKNIENATVEQALNHPTWKMGPKITIDSATMMNKALEIIEAHWLFDLPGEKISAIIHPQSLIHSFVEFADNSILAQLGPPDMQTPIQYALTYPSRMSGCSSTLDWSTLDTLTFEQTDFERFPALKLAYEVIEAGGSAGAILNAANEAAVAAFLEHKIRFGRIIELVAQALTTVQPTPVDSLQTVIEADLAARKFVNGQI